MKFEKAEDPALVAAARSGDIAGFETLVRRHTGAVYAHALRFFGDSQTAEDMTQEVFVKVFRSLDSFDERARFSTWLYRITRNACLDEVRSGRRRPVPVDPLDQEHGGLDFADSAVLAATVETAMRALPPEDRDALSAVSVFGLTYAEAATVFGVPAGTVKSRVFRARRVLASTLGMTGGRA
jgi:RNA polymerase sigma-70 factor (ECF subfamily)